MNASAHIIDNHIDIENKALLTCLKTMDVVDGRVVIEAMRRVHSSGKQSIVKLKLQRVLQKLRAGVARTSWILDVK